MKKNEIAALAGPTADIEWDVSNILGARDPIERPIFVRQVLIPNYTLHGLRTINTNSKFALWDCVDPSEFLREGCGEKKPRARHVRDICAAIG